LIDFSQRISLIKDEKITTYFTPEWTNFILEKVNSWMNLFNRRLCYEDKSNSFFMHSMEKHEEENDNKETEEKNENNVKTFNFFLNFFRMMIGMILLEKIKRKIRILILMKWVGLILLMKMKMKIKMIMIMITIIIEIEMMN
jgi:hypothetical protein